MNENKPVKHGALWTVLFAVVSLFWIFPIVLVLINSFKQKAYISKNNRCNSACILRFSLYSAIMVQILQCPYKNV